MVLAATCDAIEDQVCGKPLATERPDLKALAQGVAQHYGDGIACAIVTREADCLRVRSQWSSDGMTLPPTMQIAGEEGFTMFHHHVARALPIIVDGASTKLDGHPISNSLGLRFYAAAPLVPSSGSSSECLGVIAIVGRNRVEEFLLSDAQHLMASAAIVANVLENDGIANCSAHP
eukprot:TRINITY_DN9446_c0_g1_i1.p1 TRINITY_DN9446_c0_g1~~TRINITY_DN9446_c0_g1_i1.p1  ORF type:complete len:176 (+),score=32.20 TRINITY_DN9446_c0_g1_i1:83-610(+)